MMTAQQYLLNQAEHCRRTAEQANDPFVADELKRLAEEFAEKARQLHREALLVEAAA